MCSVLLHTLLVVVVVVSYAVLYHSPGSPVDSRFAISFSYLVGQ